MCRSGEGLDDNNSRAQDMSDAFQTGMFFFFFFFLPYFTNFLHIDFMYDSPTILKSNNDQSKAWDMSDVSQVWIILLFIYLLLFILFIIILYFILLTIFSLPTGLYMCWALVNWLRTRLPPPPGTQRRRMEHDGWASGRLQRIQVTNRDSKRVAFRASTDKLSFFLLSTLTNQ